MVENQPPQRAKDYLSNEIVKTPLQRVLSYTPHVLRVSTAVAMLSGVTTYYLFRLPVGTSVIAQSLSNATVVHDINSDYSNWRKDIFLNGIPQSTIIPDWKYPTPTPQLYFSPTPENKPTRTPKPETTRTPTRPTETPTIVVSGTPIGTETPATTSTPHVTATRESSRTPQLTSTTTATSVVSETPIFRGSVTPTGTSILEQTETPVLTATLTVTKSSTAQHTSTILVTTTATPTESGGSGSIITPTLRATSTSIPAIPTPSKTSFSSETFSSSERTLTPTPV